MFEAKYKNVEVDEIDFTVYEICMSFIKFNFLDTEGSHVSTRECLYDCLFDRMFIMVSLK